MARTSHTVYPSPNAHRRDAQPTTARSQAAQAAAVAQCNAPRLVPVPLPALGSRSSAHTHCPTASVPMHRDQGAHWQGHVAQGGALQLQLGPRAGAAPHTVPVSSAPRAFHSSPVPPSYGPPRPAPTAYPRPNAFSYAPRTQANVTNAAPQAHGIPKPQRHDSYPLPPTPTSSPPPPAATSVPSQRRRDSENPQYKSYPT